MVGYGILGVFTPSKALSTSITRCAVVRSCSQTFISLLYSWFLAATGWRSSEFWNIILASLRTPVSPEWSCGAVGEGGGLLQYLHLQNHSLAHFSIPRERGAANTLDYFHATSWKDSSMLSMASVYLLVVKYFSCLFTSILSLFIPDSPPLLSDNFDVSV